MNHLIFTEPGFAPPNWKQGISGALITQVTNEKPGGLAAIHNQGIVWVLSSVPNWEDIVRSYSAQGPVIVISKLTRLPEMQKAMEAGARGYIEALANPVQYQQAAETVSQGALWIAAPMLTRMLSILSKALPPAQEPADWQEKLSKREREVANMVVKGLSNREVAEKLHITVRTVKEHMSSIFAKLGVQDRLHLVLLARKGGGEGLV